MLDIDFDIENKEQTLNWLKRVREGLENAKPLWKALTPKITEFVDYEFDPNRDSHKKWAKLSPSYREWKRRKGFPVGIGYLRGNLKKGAGQNANKKYGEKSLLWKVNHSGVRSKKGYKYAWVFHKGNTKGTQPARPIYQYTVLRINSFVGHDIKKDTGITYGWLKKAIKEAGK